MAYYLVALHKSGAKTTGARILDIDLESKETRAINNVTYKNIVDGIVSNQFTIENVGVSGGKLIGLNGQLSRYGVIHDGIVIGKCPLVVLLECDMKTYLVSNPLGQVKYMTEQDIIRYAESEGIANGKIVHTTDSIYLSAIEGEYPKDKLIKQKGTGNILKMKMKVLGYKEYTIDENNLAHWNPDVPIRNEELELGSGCLGIAPGGFAGSPYTKIKLPKTVETIGDRAFEGMANLTELIIPEGVTVIPDRMCRNCKSLTKISLPNSVKKVGDYVFMGCNKLKTVEIGRNSMNLVSRTIPRGVNIKMRGGR